MARVHRHVSSKHRNNARRSCDPMKVLRVLKSDPNISCFDRVGISRARCKSLLMIGFGTGAFCLKEGYPWTQAIIRRVQRNALADWV